MRELHIQNFTITEQANCYIVAEIGHNHQGKLETCKEMFKVAKECGANAVKLQKRSNRELYTRAMFDKPYENENSYGETYGLHREALEFGKAEYAELKKYAKELGIVFFATAFDFASVDFLAELDMPAYKIASGDLRNIPLLKYAAKTQKPIIMSTGGGTMEDVQRAHDAVMGINPNLCILQCTAGYPAEFNELSLRVIQTFRHRFPDTIVGFSSHDNGIAMAVAAYVLGARVIEKHFTLNRAWKGTDHKFSLEPVGLRKLVRDIQRVHVAMGDGKKSVYPSEVEPIKKMGKKIVAARDLPKGHILGKNDVAFKSPGDGGLHPFEVEKVLGRVLNREVKEDEAISFAVLHG